MSVLWLLVFLLPFLLVLWAQRRLSRAYARAAVVVSRSGLAGRQAAALILHAARIRDVRIVEVHGTLTDYYDPKSRTLALSRPNFAGSNLAALAIAAHEAGHAVQQRVGSGLIDFRQFYVVVAQLGAPLAYVLAGVGLATGMAPVLMTSVALLAIVGSVQLATLPIELDASQRAMNALLELGIITRAELPAVRSLLSAALVVYLASFVSFVAPLVDLIVRCFDSPRPVYAKLKTR